MALGRAFSVAVSGVDGCLVEIEADVGRGLPGVHIVGLPDAALQESRDRVRAAVINSGEEWPDSRVILALSPATLPKVGSVYDLALALSVLDAADAVPRSALETTVLLGELALDGRLRMVRGVLSAVITAKSAGWPRVVVPESAMSEAALVEGIEVLGAGTFADVTAWLRGTRELARPGTRTVDVDVPCADLSDIRGQEDGLKAVEIAAAGAHHLLLTGSPGVGKTMLAQRIPGILPPLAESEALEVTAIHSLAGLLSEDRPLITTPPFVAPHHTTTIAALIGGGTGTARPGAVSQAHRGVLFLDECAEIGVKTLDALRTPLEEGEVRVARRDGVARYPARFQLVLAANPCPCAPPREVDCVCASSVRRRYQSKLSGPLIDRVDLRVKLAPPRGRLTENGRTSSAEVAERVRVARAAAARRWGPLGFRTNGELPGPVVRSHFPVPHDVIAPLERLYRSGHLTARGADRAMRVAWTLCDLRGDERPSAEDMDKALHFREGVQA